MQKIFTFRIACLSTSKKKNLVVAWMMLVSKKFTQTSHEEYRSKWWFIGSHTRRGKSSEKFQVQKLTGAASECSAGAYKVGFRASARRRPARRRPLALRPPWAPVSRRAGWFASWSWWPRPAGWRRPRRSPGRASGRSGGSPALRILFQIITQSKTHINLRGLWKDVRTLHLEQRPPDLLVAPVAVYAHPEGHAVELLQSTRDTE